MVQRAVLFGRFFVVAALAAGAPTHAHAAGDAQTGAVTASRWCSACHLIGPGETGATTQGPPSFQTVARLRTDDQLKGFLANPHPPMPPLELSRADIDNLIAYIATMR